MDNVPREIRKECTEALVRLGPRHRETWGVPTLGVYPMRRGSQRAGSLGHGLRTRLSPGLQEDLDSHDDRDFFEQAWGEMAPIEQGLNLEAVFEGTRTQPSKRCSLSETGWSTRRPPSADAGRGQFQTLIAKDLKTWTYWWSRTTFWRRPLRRPTWSCPGSAFTEKHGTFTSLERRVQHIRPAYKVKNSQARPEWETICGLARRMGASGFDFQDASEIMDEIASLVPDYAGISHSRLEGEAVLVARPDPSNPLPIQVLYSEKEHKGLQLPCTGPDHPGTPCLFEEGFTGDNRPTIAAPEFRTVHLNGAGEQSLLLVPGRVLYSDRPMEVVSGAPQLHQSGRTCVVAPRGRRKSWGSSDGDPVEVKTRSQLDSRRGYAGRLGS